MRHDQLLQHLCHKIFIGTQDGKKLLELMKQYHLMAPVFPCDADKMERHGGALGWSAFRAGELNFLLRLEVMANEYEQKLLADNQQKENT